MLKDLQEYTAEIQARVAGVDFAYTDGLDPDFRARAFVFADAKFDDAEAAEAYLMERLEYGAAKIKKWKKREMKSLARLIVQAASDGLSLLKRPTV